jgi:hypothetical protein
MNTSMGDSTKLDRVLLGAALLTLTLSWWLGARPVALDPDAMNLAYGMRQFDITHFTPHAPGYLLYVWTLRAVHAIALRGDSLLERFATVQWVALLFALATVATVYATARRMRLPPGSAGWAAMVIAVHPILVFHTIDAQTHSSEAFASALLLWGAIRYREMPGSGPALVLGLLLAFGSALRPSFVVFGIPVVVWTIGFRRFWDLVMAALASMAGALAWILPTVAASGGWEIWRAATRGLVHHGFVLTSSPLSETAVLPLVRSNQLSLGLWSVLTLTPLLVALALRATNTPAMGVRFTETSQGRWLRGALLIGGALAVIYYGVTFISEPGYLAALLPPVALYVGALASGSKGMRVGALAVAVTLATWWLPLLPNVLKVPSIAEWQRRTVLAEVYAEHIERSLPPEGRFLAIIAHPDITVGRQLPMLSPRVDSLLVHDGRRPWIAATSLTYVTEDDSVPIPEAFGAPGAETSFRASRAYRGIFFDGTLPPHFQEQLRAVSSCALPAAQEITETRLIPVECLSSAVVELDGLELSLPKD